MELAVDQQTKPTVPVPARKALTVFRCIFLILVLAFLGTIGWTFYSLSKGITELENEVNALDKQWKDIEKRAEESLASRERMKKTLDDTANRLKEMNKDLKRR